MGRAITELSVSEVRDQLRLKTDARVVAFVREYNIPVVDGEVRTGYFLHSSLVVHVCF